MEYNSMLSQDLNKSQKFSAYGYSLLENMPTIIQVPTFIGAMRVY